MFFGPPMVFLGVNIVAMGGIIGRMVTAMEGVLFVGAYLCSACLVGSITLDKVVSIRFLFWKGDGLKRGEGLFVRCFTSI